MTKEELEYRLSVIDQKIDLLNKEREQLVKEYRRQNPPALGVAVQDGVGTDDKFGGA